MKPSWMLRLAVRLTLAWARGEIDVGTPAVYERSRYGA